MFKQLIGNKCDLEHKRKVATAEAQALADKHNMSYIETSAKDDTNVEQSFRKLAETICRKLQSEKGAGVNSVNVSAGKEARSGPKCCPSS